MITSLVRYNSTKTAILAKLSPKFSDKIPEDLLKDFSGMVKQGEKVNYTFKPRGAYGWPVTAAAVVIRSGPSKVLIGLMKRDLGQSWQAAQMWVKPSSLKERTEHVDLVDSVDWFPAD